MSDFVLSATVVITAHNEQRHKCAMLAALAAVCCGARHGTGASPGEDGAPNEARAETLSEPSACFGPRTGTVIRPCVTADRQAVRGICCRTAFRNLGSDRMFEDREVHADHWTRYYTDHRPQEASVIEPGGKVIGYVFGCSDHARFHRVMARRIVPSCLVRALWRRATGQYCKPATHACRRHMIFRRAPEAPPIDTPRYPALYHRNILRQGDG